MISARMACVCFVALLCACTNRPVATVGKYSIGKKDVSCRNTIIRIYYPSNTQDAGLDQLIRAFTYAEILTRNGHPVTDELIRREEERINKTTLMPEMLARIKGIFQGDQEAYRRVFVLPTYVERVIYYEFFLKNPQVQAESRKMAESFLQKSKGKAFAELAGKEGYRIASFKVSVSQGLEWERSEIEKHDLRRPTLEGAPLAVSRKLDESKQDTEGKRWLDEIISRLKPGETSDKIIDMETNWMLVRYVKRLGKDTYQMQGAFVPKANYEKWLEQEKAKVEARLETPRILGPVKE